MSEGKWIVALTNSQRMALVDLIIEHMLARSTSEEFVDCSSPDMPVTRPRDFLILLDQATWVSGFFPAKINNCRPETPANVKS
jgi:hypothetical protein